MKVKYIKTYLMQGQIDITDTYEVIVDKDKLKQYKEENDIDDSLQEMLEDLKPFSFNKKYFNGSVSFKLVTANKFSDDYGNNDKELLEESIEFV